ncbi:MAG: ABC transporter ATP-binding protein [Acetobacteraceae bacterium]|nr:ABC transporter ATP-binding protein [Acetobacteraceae bacterium]
MVAPPPLLRVEGLTVRFDAVTALDTLDLEVGAGELFVLLGGSGSGKTTLLRAIAGFVRPDAGRILLDGADIGSLPPHRRPVNTMFQSYALFPHMSAAGNIAFGLRQKGASRREAAARVDEMLELVRLSGLGARRPHELSGGQQQRVALARSLAPRPRLLLLDEPLSALDRNLREQTRQELVRLQRALGTTFILVTHDQHEALSAASRIGVMQGGRLAQVGTPEAVYERPRSRFVAEFLGAANMLPATVQATTADGLVLRLDGTGACVAAVSHATLPVGRSVMLAVRPERLRLGAEEGTNRLDGTVAEATYGGESLVQAVRLADGSVIRAAIPLSRGLDAQRLAAGGRVTLSWDKEAAIVLEES